MPTNQPTPEPSPQPTNQPSTSPTSAPIGEIAEIQSASFDTEYGVPRCNLPGAVCDSLGLLNGRGTFTNGVEPNLSNTNRKGNSCVDGNSGEYHNDESIDQIIITAGDIVSGTPLPSGDFIVEGGRAYVSVKVWCWSTGASDTADIYLTNDATNPDWNYLVSMTCPDGGEQTLRHAFDVPQGLNQMIRVNFRYAGSQSSCSNGNFDDHDDLGFTVKKGTAKQTAAYDPTLKIPKCSIAGSSCDSKDLLDGRGENCGEANQPNTLNPECTDGLSGVYHDDESVDKIVVSSASGFDLTEGEIATIRATVWCWGDGAVDSADFYYASDASNPVWIRIGREPCPGGGEQSVTMSYTLPQGATQAVRVNIMYDADPPGDSNCRSGSWDDTDDLAITVQPNPTSTLQRAVAPIKDDGQGAIVDGGKDVEEDNKKKELMDMNKSDEKPKRKNEMAEATKTKAKPSGNIMPWWEKIADALRFGD